jgi:prolyl-tRNA editing enzyme YbaK/EbsC (Cys-tRNA(Pro) deacylase)
MAVAPDEPVSGAAPAEDPAGRVRRHLELFGLADEIVHFAQSTKTAQMAADVMGCELGQIAKSLVFSVDGEPVLALVAGDRRGDADAIAHELGGESARLADQGTVARATGYGAGAVSPFALGPELDVLIDESLLRFEAVYPAAGTSSSMVRVPVARLPEVTGGRVAAIAR